MPSYKLTFCDRVLKFPNWNGLVSYITELPKNITLLSNEYGTLNADTLSGLSGDIIHLTATPNEDCHFINYETTACEIDGDDLIVGTTDNYNKSFTSNSTGVNYGISAKLQVSGYRSGPRFYKAEARYVAANTTGTWVATGIAP